MLVSILLAGQPGWEREARSARRRSDCSTIAGLRARVPLTAAACIALAVPAPALAARQVSYPVLLQQVKTGPLIRAISNHKRGDIEIKFRNLDEWEAFYPPGAQPQLQRLLHQRHIRVIFASRHRAKPKPGAVHHHLRYIAAGILAALVLAGAAWAYARRRPARASPRGAAPPAATAAWLAEDAPPAARRGEPRRRD